MKSAAADSAAVRSTPTNRGTEPSGRRGQRRRTLRPAPLRVLPARGSQTGIAASLRTRNLRPRDRQVPRARNAPQAPVAPLLSRRPHDSPRVSANTTRSVSSSPHPAMISTAPPSSSAEAAVPRSTIPSVAHPGAAASVFGEVRRRRQRRPRERRRLLCCRQCRGDLLAAMAG